MVSLPEGSRVAAMAETRPLMAAEPILRAPRPEMVEELNGACSAAKVTPATPSTVTTRYLEMRMGDYLELVGNLKMESSTGTLTSAFSKMIFCLSVAPLGPPSIENGKK